MLLLKALARVVEIVLMAVIALFGIGVGLYCLDGLISLGSGRPDRLLHLPSVRDHIGHFLHRLTFPGSVAVLTLVCGVVAVIIGLLLLIGLLGSRRERLLVVEHDGEHGDLSARRRTVSQMIRAETLETPGVTGAKRPKVRVSRNGEGARLKVLAARGPDPDAATVDQSVHERLDPISERFHLKSNIRVRLIQPKAEKGARR